MVKTLENKVAVITGGTSGIGEATVRLFVSEGANVLFTGRDEEKGKNIEQGLGADAQFFRADVLNKEEVKATVERAVEHFGRIDILFNNAGGPIQGNVEDVSEEQFRYAMDLLVGSVVFGMKYAAPYMKAQSSGRIINNSSITAFRAYYGYLYDGAKAAVTQLTRVAGMRLGRYGITVNSISPGAVVTPVTYGGSQQARTLTPEDNQKRLEMVNERLRKATPVQRAGQPMDVAYAALYLASDGASFVNCHDLVVDGGNTAGGRDHYSD